MTTKDVKKKNKVVIVFVFIAIGLFIIFGFLFKVSILRLIGLRDFDALFLRLTCVGKDKQYMTWGFMANPVCVTTYPDKGKPCKSSSECQSGLCVQTSNIKESYCRGLSSDFPLCSDGEATVESLAESQGGMFDIFMFCD